MRLRLVGYSGVRPPVPGTEVVNPEDPEPTPDPVPDPDDIPPPLTLVLADGATFHKGDYLALGYNRFDVICIGGAGGRAGTVKQIIPDSGTHRQVEPFDYDLYWDAYRCIFGGAGGGGGIHRVKGRLALLPTSVAVVVGQPGADVGYSEVHSPFHDWRSGTSGYAAAPIPGPGGNGGTSSFGGVICRASGGKGGTGVIGGAGGVGNTDVAGGGPTPAVGDSVVGGGPGGGAGSHVLTPNPGKWDGKIGSGGAGGAGTTIVALNGDFASGAGIAGLSHGADGAYSASDPSISGKGDAGVGFGLDYTRITSEIVDGHGNGNNVLIAAHYDAASPNPGAGGGATTFPLNGELTQYGSKAGGRDGKGAVIIRLTYAIV